ncbi:MULTISPECIES: serine hydrolase domain-containing protein [Pseudoalteromonas]|uniref:Serine hydrolase domain-containing protein n=1 Tax=Pseudoalteromonas obscura TaxID=3048491 RepID=A0ABT7EL59_9GAMM|nr:MULTISPECIES: serine hydrolase domain-containing protein [Pseudoalteromonas]MBQ4837674.1 serine hydrolase [Pseudoalteromonas luteoviolacea]MDK2595745.1 serine hydrolase domain-containing protein [Pseudoalteromonas sp. P94(2023)]
MGNSINLKKAMVLVTALSLSGTTMANNDSQFNHTAPVATQKELQGRFWDLSELDKAFISAAPQDMKDGTPVGKLALHSKNQDVVMQFAQEVANKKHGDYTSMLISHQGKLVFESYFLRGRVNLPHDQASAVKGYTSLLLGRTIQLGYLTMTDLHKPLVNFLPELDAKKFTQGAQNITLHKALIMSGGLQISEDKAKELSRNQNELSSKTLKKLKGQGFIQELLEHSQPITDESQQYRYGNYNPTLVMQVIDAVVPGGAEQFIKKELLNKLGITNFTWANAISGLPEGGWRASMTSRDMLKLAQLVKNNGKWQGEQLISQHYLNKAMQKLIRPVSDWIPKHYSYGYFWYQTDINVKGKNYNANIAWGGGGQRLIIIKELDLTVVITGYDREDTIFDQIAQRVVPAFI